MVERLSSLGTVSVSLNVRVAEKAGWFCRKPIPREFKFLDWTGRSTASGTAR